MAMTPRTLRVAAPAALLASVWIAQPLFAAQADPARDYPSRPVRFIVPFVPGVGTDITTRTVAKKLTEMWGQQVVADNRAGAAGAIGADITAKANPDGYTLCLISSGHTVLAATNDKLPYNLEKDLHAVSQVSTLFYVLTVNPSFPAQTVKELIAYAKANPGKRGRAGAARERPRPASSDHAGGIVGGISKNRTGHQKAKVQHRRGFAGRGFDSRRRKCEFAKDGFVRLDQESTRSAARIFRRRYQHHEK